ncbi:VCBS repeat-containing protein [Nibrella saemangeumensis]|uniref:VCBS repeat-containing protein n=1 Tax=Nibrella saemangeumensis TaxID=1084526 RepID=A0ABP8MP86_9BACT
MRLLVALVVGLSLVSCRTGPKPLFEKVSGRDSGVRFANTLNATDSLNAFTFTNFYNGGGVGVGDFNRDGKPDLFFTGNQQSCRLYINQTASADRRSGQIPTEKSDFKFADVTETAGVHTNRWCTGVSVVDINQDGWDDIYVSVAAHKTLPQSRNLLFINQRTPTPTFKEEAALYGLDYDGFTTQAAFFDYDLDGDLDVFLLNTAPDLQNPNYLRPAVNDGTYPSTDRLFRNEGVSPAGRPVFRDVSREAGIRFEGLGLGVVVSDLNQDGYPDLYCSNDFISSDVLYLNNGNEPGTFSNTTRTSLAHTSLYGMGVDAADVNNDGWIDLMQLDMLPKENERQKMMLSSQDYDKKELSQRPQYGYQLQYMRNTLQINNGVRPGGRSRDVGDDLPAANSTPDFSEIGLLAGIAQTDWSWTTLLTDLDQDGRKDIFITNGYRKNVTDKDFISFTEEFGLFGTDAAREQVRSKVLEKVPEIKLRNYAFRNQSDLTFSDVSAAWGLDELSYANGAAYADLDQDGDPDLIVNNIDEEASLFRNNSREQQKNGFLSVGLEGPAGNRAGIGATLTVWAGGGRQVFEQFPVRGYLSSVAQQLVVGLGTSPVADSVKVVWPGGLTEVRYNIKANQKLVFTVTEAKPASRRSVAKPDWLFTPVPNAIDFTHEESDFVDFKTTPALHKMLSRSGVAMAVGDLNGDKIDDIAVGASYRGSAGALFFGKASGEFTRTGWMANTPMEVGDILLFDADNDGDNDLLAVGGGNERPLSATDAYQPILYLNDGRGHFEPTTALPTMAVSSQCVRALDYDRDGDLDILITGHQIPGQYPLPARSYLLRNERVAQGYKDRVPEATRNTAPGARHTGQPVTFTSLAPVPTTQKRTDGLPLRFTDVTADVAPALANLGMVCDALPLDFNLDGYNDLVLVGEWMPPTLLLNQKGRFITATADPQSLNHSITQSLGWWNCLATGDFDHDGDADLLLGNEGLNTLYRASESEPIGILANDFNQDGQFDPIMGYFINGTRYPALPRETLNQQIIQFRRKYQHYADYAKADFDQLFSKEDREAAFQGEVTELRSCYAENVGGGQFRIRPLPVLAQQAPVFGFLVDDFDRDGHLDALATGNFFGNEANMGRQDASRGLLLKGDGKGGFTPLGPGQTGFRVSGDARRSYRLHNPERIITAINSGTPVFHKWMGGQR